MCCFFGAETLLFSTTDEHLQVIFRELRSSTSGSEELFGSRPVPQVFAQIHPAHRSARVHQELGRAGAWVQQVVTLDRFRLGIGTESNLPLRNRRREGLLPGKI